MLTSLALMTGAVLFGLMSYWSLPSSPWFAFPGFLLACVMFVGAIWAYVHKNRLEDLPHSATRSVWWALLHVLMAIVGGALAYELYPQPLGVMQGVLALLFGARGIKIFLDRHKVPTA